MNYENWEIPLGKRIPWNLLEDQIDDYALMLDLFGFDALTLNIAAWAEFFGDVKFLLGYVT